MAEVTPTPLPILVLSGPNLNELGVREPAVYGSTTLAEIERGCGEVAARFGRSVETFQSNWEGALVDRLQQSRTTASGLVVNAGALTHTSVALRDAIVATGLPCVEVHLSNVHRREPFRHHSYLSDISVGVIVGLGPFGYHAGVEYLCTH
jgi:3-dehydroquinate dehydratase II